jgi:molybdenum-dependent DNA-binding transcriptional regulator ModE
VNSFLGEVVTSRNEGTLIDIKKTAEKYGIDYEKACAILSSMEDLFKRNGLN